MKLIPNNPFIEQNTGPYSQAYRYYLSRRSATEIEDAVKKYQKAEAKQTEWGTCKPFRELVLKAAEHGYVRTSAADLHAGIISFLPPKTKVTKSSEQKKLSSFRPIGTKVDLKKLKKKSIQDAPEISAEDDVALRAQITMKYCKDIIEPAICAGRELTEKERTEIAKFHHALQVISGNLPDPGLNMLHAMPEFLTHMQERAREICKDLLAKHLCPPPIQGQPNDEKLKPATNPQAQARSLGELNLPANTANTPVTVVQVQDALLQLGPDNTNITSILTGLGIPVAAHQALRNVLRSQKKLDEQAKKANSHINAKNKKRETGKDSEGKDSEVHVNVQKAFDNLKSVETWNRLVKDFSPEAKKAGLSSVAALEAARAVLDSPTDLKPADIQDKISKPVTDAGEKDAKVHTEWAQAAQKGAERAIGITHTHLQESQEAKSAAEMAIRASNAANCILGMRPEEFKAQDFEVNNFGEFNHPVENNGQAPTRGMALVISSDGQRHIKIETLKNESNPAAQKRVALAAAVADALDTIPEVKYPFCTDIANQYFENGHIEEKALNDLIERDFLGRPEIHQKIRAAIRIGQATTEGIAASNQAVAATKSDTKAAGKKHQFPIAITNAVAHKLQSQFENNQLTDAKRTISNAVIKDVLQKETNRANLIIKAVHEIKEDNLKIKQKPSQAGTALEIKGLPKKLKDAVIKNYLDTGRVDDKAIEAAITLHLPEGETKPSKTELIQTFRTAIGTLASGLAPAVAPNMSTSEELKSAAVGPKSAEIDEFAKEVTDIYDKVPGKVAYQATKTIAESAGVPAAKVEEVAKAVQQEVNAGKTPAQTAEVAIKLLGPQYEAAFVPLTAVLSRQVGLPIGKPLSPTAPLQQGMVQRLDRQAIQKAFAQSRAQATHSTSAAAIGSAVGEYMTREGIPSAHVVDAIVKTYLQHGFDSHEIENAINTETAAINGKAEDLFAYWTNNNDHYLGLENCPPDLKQTIKTALLNHYVVNGNLDRTAAEKIITEKVSADQSNPPFVYAVLPADSFSLNEPAPNGFYPLPHQRNFLYQIQDSQKEKIIGQTYKAILISTGLQAIKATAKDADKNTRAVAGAVALVATSYGVSQEDALKWSKTLADYYAKQRSEFDKLDSKELRNLCPALAKLEASGTDEEAAKRIITAAKAAGGVPPKADAMEAATSVAAKTYPSFDKPIDAAAMSTIIGEAHHGDSRAVSNASAYAENLGKQALTDYSHFSVGAAMAAAAATADAQNKVAGALGAAMLTLPTQLFLSRHNGVAFSQILQNTINESVVDLGRNPSPQQVTIATQFIGTALQLGLTTEQAKATASIISEQNILNRPDREDLVSATTVALAFANAKATRQSIYASNRALNPPQFRNGLAVGARQAEIAQTPGRSWNATVVEQIAKEEYLATKKATQEASKQSGIRTSQIDRIAEINGKSAMLEVYLTAMQNSAPDKSNPAHLHLSHDDFERLSAKASALSREIEADAQLLKQSGTLPAGVSIPAPVETSVVRDLAASSVTSSLIHKGIAQGQNIAGDDKLNEKAMAAIEAIIETETMAEDEAKDETAKNEFLAAAKKVLESPCNAAEAGAIIATLHSFPSEVARSLAAVVAHFKTAAGDERSLAIKQATTAASIMMEERAALPTPPADAEKSYSLKKFNQEELDKRKQEADDAFAAMINQEKHSHPDIDDGMGIAKGLKDEHLDDKHNISTKNIENWTITLNSFGGRGHQPKTKRLSEFNDAKMKAFIERMKKCDGYVNVQTLKEAIAEWNNSHSLLSQISKNAITSNDDGSYDIALDLLSNDQIFEFLNIVAKHSEAAKEKAIANPEAVKPQQKVAQSTTSLSLSE